MAQMMGRSNKSIIQAYRDEGRISDAPHKRHPRATTAAQDMDILDAAQASPFSTTKEIGACAGVPACKRATFTTHWDQKQRVWHPVNARYDPLCVQEVASSGRTGVNVWGAMSRDGLGVLHRIEGPLTSARYCDILDYVMIPYALDGPFLDGDFLLRQDLSPVHTTKVVEELLNMRGVQCLRWVSGVE
ncbi:hypothetical protein HPB49_006166 [Dermacentor silvarum]|uniref:Uncharacterized protein n=1 Tax=Dermacentor silvarum TaxID=543639 RepID=A0ACB8CJR0_DERSI|nr:hypothetical protein HPB49_006166 [Dermacentor silvarum]